VASDVQLAGSTSRRSPTSLSSVADYEAAHPDRLAALPRRGFVLVRAAAPWARCP